MFLFLSLQKTTFIVIDGDPIVFQSLCHYVQSSVIDNRISTLLKYILRLNLKLAVAPLRAGKGDEWTHGLEIACGVRLTELEHVYFRFVRAEGDPLWIHVECDVIYLAIVHPASKLLYLLTFLLQVEYSQQSSLQTYIHTNLFLVITYLIRGCCKKSTFGIDCQANNRTFVCLKF